MKDKYSVAIDFDEASKQWRKNKIEIGEGYFLYVKKNKQLKNKNKCTMKTKKGVRCKNKVFKDNKCNIHYQMNL